MDVEELELKIAIVGLLWSFLQNERQRRHVAKLRPGRNIVQGPIVRRWGGGATTSEVVGANIVLWQRIATGRQRLLQKFLADGARWSISIGVPLYLHTMGVQRGTEVKRKCRLAS